MTVEPPEGETAAERFRSQVVTPPEGSWPSGYVQPGSPDGRSFTFHEEDRPRLPEVLWEIVRTVPHGGFEPSDFGTADFDVGDPVSAVIHVEGAESIWSYQCNLYRGEDALRATVIEFDDGSRHQVAVKDEPLGVSGSISATEQPDVLYAVGHVIDSEDAIRAPLTEADVASLEKVEHTLWKIVHEVDLPDEVREQVEASLLLLRSLMFEVKPGETKRWEAVGIVHRGLAALAKLPGQVTAHLIARGLVETLKEAGFWVALARYFPDF